MRLITGDECGLIKETIPELARAKQRSATKPVQVQNSPRAVAVVKNVGTAVVNVGLTIPTRTKGVVDLTWLETDEDNSFASLCIDGSVQVWQRSVSEEQTYGRYRQVAAHANIFASQQTQTTHRSIHPSTSPIGMSAFPASNANLLCAADAQGNVTIVNHTAETPIVRQFSPLATSAPSNGSKDPLITAMAVDAKRARVAMGGRERETVLYDLETTQAVWKAKNLPPDPQTLLQALVWPTSILFLNAYDSSSLGQNVLAVGTAHRQVRIYDIRDDSVQRRPFSVTPAKGFVEHRVTALCQMDPYSIVVGDSSGDLHTIDVRKLEHKYNASTQLSDGRYPGPAGSIRSLAKHESLPFMAVVGLDRMLRIYDTNSRKQVNCMYLKQRVNCVLMGRDGTWGVDGEDYNNSDVEQDDIVRDYVDSDHENGDDQSFAEEESIDQANHTDDSENDAKDDSASGSSDSGDHQDDDSDDNKSQNEEPTINPRKRVKR